MIRHIFVVNPFENMVFSFCMILGHFCGLMIRFKGQKRKEYIDIAVIVDGVNCKSSRSSPKVREVNSISIFIYPLYLNMFRKSNYLRKIS